jgi:hypothetical protein
MKRTNKIRNITLAVMAIVAIAGLHSCIKKESFPDTPEIELASFVNVYDTGAYAAKGILTINFKDGDGDIGLNPGDTLPPYDKEGNFYYNFVIDYFEKQYGQFVKLDLEPPFSARIPVLIPYNPGKAIKGFISDTLTMNRHPVFDTIKLEVYIYDRALHKSNVVSTSEIILKR